MRKLLLILLCLLVIGILFVAQQTHGLRIARYTWEAPRVPRGFNGFQIALVSDLHNKRFGKAQKRLVKAVKKLQPDMIALAGDFIDLETETLDFTRAFLKGIKNLAPMYWVDGNHDPNSPFYGELHELLDEYGVTVLAGDVVTLQRNGGGMTLAGYPFWELFYQPAYPVQPADIMLYHGPDEFYRFAALGCGLVLSGHNHGGQVALPNGRAILGPDHGLFPPYSGGVYTDGEATMILSRGLGVSGFPLRVFAMPEVVGVELKAKEQ